MPRDLRLTMTRLFSPGPLKPHSFIIEILKPPDGSKANAVSAPKSWLQPRKLSLVVSVSQIAGSCAGPSGSPESKTRTTRRNGLQEATPHPPQPRAHRSYAELVAVRRRLPRLVSPGSPSPSLWDPAPRPHSHSPSVLVSSSHSSYSLTLAPAPSRRECCCGVRLKQTGGGHGRRPGH